jgi:hypothetical protein
MTLDRLIPSKHSEQFLLSITQLVQCSQSFSRLFLIYHGHAEPNMN